MCALPVGERPVSAPELPPVRALKVVVGEGADTAVVGWLRDVDGGRVWCDVHPRSRGGCVHLRAVRALLPGAQWSSLIGNGEKD